MNRRLLSLCVPNFPFQPTLSTGKLLCFLSGLHRFLDGPCLPGAFTVGFCVFFLHSESVLTFCAYSQLS